MPSRPDRPADDEARDPLDALDGPADDELELSGPGEGNGDDHRLMPDHLPGGVGHTTAAAGAGGLGLVLLGIAAAAKRRWTRRRYDTLDE